jgi:recombination protein RecA
MKKTTSGRASRTSERVAQMAGADREKALDTAMAQIKRAHGEGSVMRLGEQGRAPVETIPTGAIALDIALGIGGLPRGRVVEIYGPESSGKCLTADTYVWTDRGLETVAEVFARCGQAASCTSRVTDVRDNGVRAVNERGELEGVAAITHNNRKPVVRIRLRSGRTVTATKNHPVRVLSERGFIVWRTAGRLAPGDVVVSALFGATEAAGGDDLSENEAVMLGYLIAEGSLGQRHSVNFTSWDPEVSSEYTRIVEQLFDVTVKHNDDKEHVVHNTAWRTLLAEKYDLGYGNAADKYVPSCVRVGGHKSQRAFLSALFEGDGWIDPSSTVGLGTASEQLAREVQLMLYGLGIPATVTSAFNQTYQRDYWSVTINPAVAHRFLEEVGFRSSRRRERVADCFRRSKRDSQFEDVPHLSGLLRDLRDNCGGDRSFDRIAGDLFRVNMDLACSKQRLVTIVQWFDERDSHLSPSCRAMVEHLRTLAQAPYTYESVVSVEEAGEQPTFDLMVPQTHSFLANGILTHNTTVALHAVANAQRAGGIAAFIDAEHALDPEYAANLGVDTDALLVSQPDSGEQALEIADMLIRSGALDIIVIDSVAALVPRAEIEGEMGDSHVGLQARLMSQALRKITGALNASGTTAVFINQLREKIGVMFGCLSYGTRVVLADGTTEQIGTIVTQKLPVEVLSYDPEADKVVPRKVVNWFDNGVADRFLQFTVEKAGGNGRAQLAATENHLVRTPGGWREAGELMVGDRVMATETHRLSDQQWQVVLGSLLGGGSLSPSRRDGNGVRLRLGHDAKQAAYLDWKVSLLGNIDCTSRTDDPCRSDDQGAAFADFTPLPELGELRRTVYLAEGQKTITEDYLKALTPLALAIWFMDSGSCTVRPKGLQQRPAGGGGRVRLCVEAMSGGSRDRVVAYLRDTHGFEVSWRRGGADQKAVLTFSTASSARFLEMVAPYVHPSMDYKLLPRLRGRFAVVPEFVDPMVRPVPARILDIHVKPPTRSMHKFDLEVEGNHNYFADGVMVHNSPETTTGGRALKFYSSVRLDVRRIETLKDGAEMVGNRTRVKVVKNKLAPPFKQAEFDILYGHGISREGGLIDVGVEQGLVRKAGAWYTYEGDQLGQGKENARSFLRDNPDLAAELEKKILEKLGVGARLDEPVPAEPTDIDF